MIKEKNKFNYRIVERVSTEYRPEFPVAYVIQKAYRFLCWTSWSDLPCVGYTYIHEYTSLEEAKRNLEYIRHGHIGKVVLEVE